MTIDDKGITLDAHYLAAEFDYHMIHKDRDMINYLASLYKTLDKHGEWSVKQYPAELFEETDNAV